MGAAGRDFHNFNVCFRNNPEYEVIAFTATQIPNISKRQYPPPLSGELYPRGIPVKPEEMLLTLIKTHQVREVIFSYSDVSHEYVMHQACRVNAAGAQFTLLGTTQTMLKSNKPVIAVCAVRTGCGKSAVSRKVCEILKKQGRKPVVIRHPMPYGDLFKQRLQKFTTYDDFKKHECTIEEIEEYEPHIEQGTAVYAGIDYGAILAEAEKDADVIVWDGGNNDTPFYVPDIYFTLTDPHRPGHELTYYPGETNLLLADAVIISKENTANKENIQLIKQHIEQTNPQAAIIDASLQITVKNPDMIRGKRVLVIEDGPSLTHGGMAFGAGVLAAQEFGALEIIDPRPFATGSLAETFRKYPHIRNLVPAMGYGHTQIEELKQTINHTPCDILIIGTPIDLRKIMPINKPTDRVQYNIEETGNTTLEAVIKAKFG